MTMQTRIVMTIAGLGILSVLVWGNIGGIAWAQNSTTEEQTLEKRAASINSMPASPKQDDARVQALAKEFNVAPSVVEGLRNQKQGWGETTIELAMAQHLAQTDPKTYPTITDALNKIETLRSEKMGWGRIAKGLGFKLGPVISKVERSETAVRTADRAGMGAGEPTSKADHSGKVERPDNDDRSVRAERAERADRPERPTKPERPGR